MKKIISILSVVFMMMSLSGICFAEGTNYNEKVFLVRGGVIVRELASDEIENIKKNENVIRNELIENKFNNIVNPPRIEFFKKSEEEDVKMKKMRERISSYVENNTSSDANRTLTLSTRITYSANVSFDFSELTPVLDSMECSVEEETSYKDSIEITVKPGKKSWYEFTPLMTKVTGKLNNYYDGINCRSYNAKIYFPQKKSGEADGILYLCESDI